MRASLALLILLGVGLRIYGLTDHGLWIDEYGTWWAIAGESAADTWERVVEIHGQSPLYYSVVRSTTSLLGIDTFSLRLPSLVAGIALLLLAYPLARKLFSSRHIALACTAAFAVDERLIYYSQEARPYALALLCAAVSFHFHVTAVRKGRVRDHALAVSFAVLAFYVHYLFGVIVLAQAAHVLSGTLRTARDRVRWLASAACFVLLCVPGLWQLREIFARRASLDWIAPASGSLERLELVVDLLDPTLLGLGLAVSVAAYAVDWLPRTSLWLHRISLPLLWIAAPVLVFSVIGSLLDVQLAHSRYLVMAAPAVPLIYGLLLGLPGAYGSGGGRPWIYGAAWRVAPLLLFMAFAIPLRTVPLLQHSGGAYWWFGQHDWAGASAELAKRYREGDLVLYRTGFVELDQVLHDRAGARTREFVAWPLLAHGGGRSYATLALPYLDSTENKSVLAEQIRAIGPRRVWLLGLDPVDTTSTSFDRLVALGSVDRPRRVAAATNHGVVDLILMRDAPSEGGQ